MSKFLRILIAAILIIQIMSLRIREPHEQAKAEGSAAGSAETSTESSSDNAGNQANQAEAAGSAETGVQGSENATTATTASTSNPIKLNPEESQKFKEWKNNLIPWTPVAGKDLS